jgi:hypothetical protein
LAIRRAAVLRGAHLKYFWAEHALAASVLSIDETSPRWRDARLALDGIIALCEERGIELIVFLNGSERMIEHNPVLALYATYLRSRGIEPHTIPAALSDTDDYRISVVDGHMNADGHAIMAKTMLQVLEPVLERTLTAPAPSAQP